MLSFEVRKPGGESEVRKVHRDVIHLGASSGNDLVVRARGVLGRHARISVVGEELRLDVLGTAPGSDVYLNGAIVRTAALASGDRIQIGEATITLLNGPAPNPNRMSAPPPRGRDALSVAAAALAPTPPAPPVPASTSRAPEPKPRTYEPVHAARVVESRPVSISAAQGFRLADVWGELFGRLRASASLDERLQEVASYLSSSTPVHSVAFLSVADSSVGEAVAAIWKGTLPRLTRRSVDEVFAAGGPVDLFESGMRLRVYPVVRPGAEAVGLLVLPMELAADPLLNDLAVALASATGFVHAERADAPFGERGSSHAPAPIIMAPLDDPATAVVGSSLTLQNLRVSLQRIASARAPVLIIGDVGTGKTLAAETLHALSPRRPRPLVRISATAATAAALEEDLLGSPGPADHRRRAGRLFEADGGTLLIEEVSDLPAPTQRSSTASSRRARSSLPAAAPFPRRPRHRHLLALAHARGRGGDVPRRPLLPPLGPHAPPPDAARPEGRRPGPPRRLRRPARRTDGFQLRRRGDERPPRLQLRRKRARARERGPASRGAAREGAGAPLGPRRQVRRRARRADAGRERRPQEIVEKVERQVIERVMRKVRGNQSLGARLLNISRRSLIAKMKEYDIKDFRYLKRQD